MACKVSDIEDGGFDALFVEEPPEFLLCVVCHLALRKPVLIIDCGHKFCNTCFQKMKLNSNERGVDLLCPLDRQVIDTSKVFPDKSIERLVFELKVKCDNEGKSCEWTGDLGSLESHLNLYCDYELVSCAHDGCNINVERKELEEHMFNCSKRIVLAADNLKLIQILSQRLDVCEKDISSKYEEQLKSLQESRDELKGQLDETKEQLNETKKEFDEIKEQLDEAKEQLDKTKKELDETKKGLHETAQKLNTNDKLNANVENLSKTIGEAVIQVKRGKWFEWKSNIPTHGVPLYSPSYLTDDGYHFKIGFRYGDRGANNLLLYVFKDELNLKRGSSKKKISYNWVGNKYSKVVLDMFDQPNEYFDQFSWSANFNMFHNNNVVAVNYISLHFLIEDVVL